MLATITKLHLYPVKSLQGIAVQEISCLETGVEYDREWVIVDQKNMFLTQRQIPAMATVKMALTDAALVFSHPEHDELHIPLNKNHLSDVTAEQFTIWKDQCMGLDEGEAASKWLTRVLGEYKGGALRLFRYDSHHKRMVRDKYTDNADAHLKFADACPFLIVNEASLDALNALLTADNLQTIPMDRFRGNIQVTGIDAWQEYDCSRIETDHIKLQAEGPCMRCPVPGIDQLTGKTKEPGQPYQTLMNIDIPTGKTGAYFGTHATFADGSGKKLKVGDSIHFI